MPLERLKLLHTSDFHLGAHFDWADGHSDLDVVAQTAQSLDVDALLIAGDLFDSSQISLDTVERTFACLEQIGLPIFLLPGNHDSVLTKSGTPAFRLPPLPANVQMFSDPQGQTIASAELGLTIWGKPVYNHEPAFRPMHGAPKRPEEGWFVVMGHGLLVNPLQLAHRSSPILLQDLEQLDCDYVALGHVHTFEQIVHNGPLSFYSGAASAVTNKTAALVTLDPVLGADVQEIPIR